MKFIVAFLLGLASAWDQEYTLDQVKALDHVSTFNTWATQFNRNYADSTEKHDRFMIWLDNLYTIGETNSEGLPYKLRLNQFSDMTSDEFRNYIHGGADSCFKPKTDAHFFKKEHDRFTKDGKLLLRNLMSVEEESSSEELQDSVDWTEKGVVTPVKNQGACGSCWSFSATGALECNYAIKTGTLNSLSEQQLVDCAGLIYGCSGCNGGQMTGAMRYAAKHGGLCSEEDYPYTAEDGSCKAETCGTKLDANTGVSMVTADSTSALEAAVNKGCVSIGIEADQIAFQHYSSGVLTARCGTSIDHGVLLVGYGTQDGQDYWKVKNSWGESWGMEGYILLCRNCDANDGEGECGILSQPSVPEF